KALLASLIVVLVAAVLAYLAHRSSRSPPDPRGLIRLDVLLIVTVAVALLVFALREALDQNFWTYPTILVGVVTAGVHRPLQRWLDRAYPGRAPTAAALAALVFTAPAIRTSAAFPLPVIGILLALDAYLTRRPGACAGLPLAVVFSGVVLLSHGAIPTIFTLLGLFASLSYAALAELDRFADRGGNARGALATAIRLLPLIVLFVRMPPIVFSLTILRLPEAIEFALYAPTVIIAATALLLAV